MFIVSPQLSGGPQGLHEDRQSGPVLPGAAGDPEPLVAPGDVPAQTRAEDPQVPPAAAGKTNLKSLRSEITGKHFQNNLDLVAVIYLLLLFWEPEMKIFQSRDLI